MGLLEQYTSKQKELKEQIEAKTLKLNYLPVYQEINYRIFVLKTIEGFCKTAPITLDKKALTYHFQLVSASIRSLINERKFGLISSDEIKSQRETACASLEKVIKDGLNRFNQFEPKKPEEYKAKVFDLINPILTVWVQFRNTYINV